MYKRVLLKLSGEALKGNNQHQVLDGECVKSFAAIIKELYIQGVQIGVVIGAGNIWRGKIAKDIGIDQVPADYMGMMGTIINAVAISSALKELGVPSVVFSALCQVPETTKPYSPKLAMKAMDEGKVAFLAGGTGKPFYTTDTAATLRAIETKCEAILMGKNGVEGVYDKDPSVHKDAKFFETITYQEILNLKLQIMDLSAIELIKDKDIEIKVFSMSDPENIIRAANNEKLGTVCKKGE